MGGTLQVGGAGWFEPAAAAPAFGPEGGQPASAQSVGGAPAEALAPRREGREGGAEPLELRLLVRRRDEAQAGAVAAEEEGGGPVARQAKPPSAKRRKARPS